MVERDASWIQIYVENSQEAYDSILQAFRIAEHTDILLPTMVMLDAFFLSHTVENVQILPNETVQEFVGSRSLLQVSSHEGKSVPLKLDPDNPITIGPLDLYDYYFEHKRQQEEAMRKSMKIIKDVNNEYQKITSRKYGNGLIDSYRLEDAEIAAICVGSTAGTVKTVVDQLREKGKKAGLLRLRTFRPFPIQEIQGALRNVKAIAVLDRSHSFGAFGGPIFHEIRNVLFDMQDHPATVNYIYGLGGRDMPQNLIKKIYEDLGEIVKTKRVKRQVQFAGLRE
jgi:pyruvate ferredoxin oxidoreductase alpha subunit